jgi:hypothetical protein
MNSVLEKSLQPQGFMDLNGSSSVKVCTQMLSEEIMWGMFIGGVAPYKHTPRHIPDKSCVYTGEKSLLT